MKSGDYDFYIIDVEVHGIPLEIYALIPPDLSEGEVEHFVNLQVRKSVYKQTKIKSFERIDTK